MAAFKHHSAIRIWERLSRQPGKTHRSEDGKWFEDRVDEAVGPESRAEEADWDQDDSEDPVELTPGQPRQAPPVRVSHLVRMRVDSREQNRDCHVDMQDACERRVAIRRSDGMHGIPSNGILIVASQIDSSMLCVRSPGLTRKKGNWIARERAEEEKAVL
jgi:hypothetical protein